MRIPKNFNPRPHTGATGDPSQQADILQFQSTPPYGGDLHYVQTYCDKVISIHAPIRGRRARSRPADIAANFNPRPHTGATDKRQTCQDNTAFQSTPPYGGDPGSSGTGRSGTDFNPRPHTGATFVIWSRISIMMISIHAPIRGRHTKGGSLDLTVYFNPRPHTGATRPVICRWWGR